MKRSARLLPVLSSLLCLLLLLFTGCSASSKGNSTEMLYSNDTADQYAPAEKPMAVEPTVEESDAGTALGTQSGGMDDRDLRKIIYNASMDITADDPAAEEAPEEAPAPEKAVAPEDDAAGDPNAVPDDLELLDTFLATAYCQTGTTATGTYTTVGRTLAVNPGVIPYGTHVWLYLEDGTLVGDYYAEDTGGNMLEHPYVIDIYMGTDYDTCIEWGVKRVSVYVEKDTGS